MRLTDDMRELVRRVSGESHAPIEVVPEWKPPALVGEAGYHTTPAGTLVRNPRAYRYRTVYHHSTRRIEVGHRWLLSHSGYHTAARLLDYAAFQAWELLSEHG